jgi:hypothetical protein
MDSLEIFMVDPPFLCFLDNGVLEGEATHAHIFPAEQ